MTETAAPSSSPATAKFLTTIQPLIEGLEMTGEAVSEALMKAKIIKAPNDKAAEALGSPDAVELDDFKRAFPDATSGDLKLAVNKMRAAAAPAPVAPAAVALPIAPAAGSGSSAFLIPEPPESSAFIQALSTSVVLRVDSTTIRAGLEALFADNARLSDIPETLANKMETFADTIEEPVGDGFMKLLKFVRERKYAEVNVDGKLVTKARKDVVISRLRQLPNAVYQFHMALTAWNEQLRANRQGNPLAGLNGDTNALFPPPDEVIGASEIVAGSLKKAFSGLGIMVATAMAYEGLKIREILEKPELPALIGAANREQMLLTLGCSMTNAEIRTERNIAKYVIFAATVVPNALPGGSEGRALEALWNLGQQILPWMQSSGRTVAPANGHTRRDDSGGGSQRRSPLQG